MEDNTIAVVFQSCLGQSSTPPSMPVLLLMSVQKTKLLPQADLLLLEHRVFPPRVAEGVPG